MGLNKRSNFFNKLPNRRTLEVGRGESRQRSINPLKYLEKGEPFHHSFTLETIHQATFAPKDIHKGGIPNSHTTFVHRKEIIDQLIMMEFFLYCSSLLPIRNV
jgi:hypothetical protein